jgi:hypothetical protein
MKSVQLGIQLVLGMGLLALGPSTATAQTVQWINHLGLVAGDSSVTQTSYTATLFFGPTIRSTTLGDRDSFGGNKVVTTSIQIPPSSTIIGVRLCYSLSNSRSFINDLRLAQIQDPPTVASVVLEDPTQLDDPGPICVNSASTSVDPSLGALLLSLRVNFGDTSDSINILSLGVITN